MAQENGRLDASSLKDLSVGGRLTPGAADAFEQLRVAGSRAGVNVTLTSAADAYRLYDIQERIFRDRYLPSYTQYAPGRVDRRSWQGRYWFRRPGTAAAAVPGTSNHGWALAVDIANVGGFNSTFYRWLTDNAPLFGFSNTEGHSVGEAWHWVYSPTLHASHGGGAAPSTPAPTPSTPEPPVAVQEDDKMFRIRVAEKTSGVANASGGTIYLCRFGNAQEAAFRALSPAENEAVDRAGIEIKRIGGRDYSENEKNLMRTAILGVRDSWGVK